MNGGAKISARREFAISDHQDAPDLSRSAEVAFTCKYELPMIAVDIKRLAAIPARHSSTTMRTELTLPNIPPEVPVPPEQPPLPVPTEPIPSPAPTKPTPVPGPPEPIPPHTPKPNQPPQPIGVKR
jgi:hypothetical protein